MLTVSTPLLKRSLARVDRATLPKQAELHPERALSSVTLRLKFNLNVQREG